MKKREDDFQNKALEGRLAQCMFKKNYAFNKQNIEHK